MAFITVNGQSKIASKQGLEQVLNITHFVFANIAGLGAEPANRIESMPISGNIVHTAAVTQSGYVNPNQVVYSIVLDSNVGNFDYNWIGLKDEGNTLIAVVYLDAVFHKTANNGSIAGNNVTRNFLLEYNGITATTAVTIPAETWQIDFTARLWGIDERERLSNFDIYGAGSFFGTGFSLTHLSGNNYQVEPGLGYVGGIRIALSAAHPLTIATKPTAIWIDASLQGNVSDVTAVYSFVTSNSVQANYTDSYGFKHFLYKIGTVNADSTVTNERIITGSTLVQPYETGGFYPGKPPVSTVIYAKPFSIPVTFPANLAGSLVYCEGAAATANTIFNLKKNGTSVGSMTVAAGSRTATFSLAGGVSFAAGDRLTVVSPATQDATLEDLSFSLIGER